MIATKLFELRDRGTFIPIIASRMRVSHEGIRMGETAEGMHRRRDREQWLLRRAGYSAEGPYLVLLTRLDGGRCAYDPDEWGSRTWTPAHEYIADHWDELESGALIDSRVILGEADAPCESEQT